MINKKPLIKFLIWVSILFVLVFFGVNNIFALETKTIYSVNNNGTLASANTYNYGYLTGGGTQGSARANVNTTINGVAYGFSFQFYENVVLNKTYTMVINFMDIDLLKTFNSSMVQISTCNSTTCNENTLVSVVKSNNNGNSNKLTIEFNPITTGPIILVNLGSDQPITGVSTFGIKSVTLDSTNQNQEIIDNQTNNTNNIINNNNSNTQEIIDNQNSNASAIQDTINSNFQDCHTSVNLFSFSNGTYTSNGITAIVNNGVITLSGTATSNAFVEIRLNLNINWVYGESYTLSAFNPVANNNVRIRIDSQGKYDTYLSSVNSTQTLTLSNTANTLSNRILIRVQSETTLDNFVIKPQLEKGSQPSNYEPYGEQICTNKLDEQTNSINNLNDNITSDNVDDNGIASSFESFNDFLDDNSTITQLITLPITLYTAILNNVNVTCQPFNLGKLYGEDLILPCINISQYLGNALWTMIDIIISGFAVYAISKKMIKVFNNFSSLREGDVIDD